MFFLLRILNGLSEYAYFVKTAHLFGGREGRPECRNRLYCLAEQLFPDIKRGRIVSEWEMVHPPVAFQLFVSEAAN